MSVGSLRILTRRVRELKDTFLPEVSATGAYGTEENDRMAAFNILVHAELEEYVERRCRETVDSVVDSWNLDSLPRSTIISLIGFSKAGGPETVGNVKKLSRSRIQNIVASAKREYSHAINDNHGIKELNLLRLLLPVGIKESQLRSDFLADMDSLGVVRGSQAHQGIGARVSSNPVDDMGRVVRILLQLRKVDRMLCDLEQE